MECATIIARRSKCYLTQVGAIIVTSDNRAMPPAYNGPAAGIPYQGDCRNWCPRSTAETRDADYSSCESIHAEANALLRADWTQIQGATIYVSAAVCISCARLIANSGISTVVHRVTEDDMHRDPDRTETFLRAAGLEVRRNQ